MLFAFEEGFSFYLLLVFIIIISSFIITLFTGAIVNIKISENIAAEQKAFYAADSAITYAQLLLKENNGIPVKKKNGENYIPGEIYSNITLNQQSRFQFIMTEEKKENLKYIIKAFASHDENKAEITAEFDNDYNLIDYKILD
ncbi:MAG: hypothetical protein ACQEQF_00850 [Bacillota bacterium]